MKTLQFLFVATIFYLLGLNTHNAVWKWIDAPGNLRIVDTIVMEPKRICVPDTFPVTSKHPDFGGIRVWSDSVNVIHRDTIKTAHVDSVAYYEYADTFIGSSWAPVLEDDSAAYRYEIEDLITDSLDKIWLYKRLQ